jgi:ribonuclease HI
MYNVNIGKALSFLRALNWVPKLQLESMDFAIDSKKVVDYFQTIGLIEDKQMRWLILLQG